MFVQRGEVERVVKTWMSNIQCPGSVFTQELADCHLNYDEALAVLVRSRETDMIPGYLLRTT